MGLDTSHNCWHGAYSAFHRWREKLCEIAGWGSLDDYVGFGELGVREFPPGDPLTVLLAHSDSDGVIEPEDCGPLADRLEGLLPLLPDEDAGGHIGHWRQKTVQFIRGLRLAAANNEPVEFH